LVVGPSDPATNLVDLVNAVGEIEFAQYDARTPKRIGFDDVAAHTKEIRMDVANNVRAAQHQHFAAILFAPVVIQRGIAFLDVGAHRAVVDDDALVHSL